MDSILTAEIKNVVNGELLEHDKMIAAIGCQTLIGCGKTKEIEAKYGKIQSDINDLSVNFDKFFKDTYDILDKLKKEISGMKNLIQYDEKDMETKIVEIGKTIKKDVEKTLDRSKKFNIWVAGILITMLGAKLFQDYQNQGQLISVITPALTSIAVLKDHDILYQKHIYAKPKKTTETEE